MVTETEFMKIAVGDKIIIDCHNKHRPECLVQTVTSVTETEITTEENWYDRRTGVSTAPEEVTIASHSIVLGDAAVKLQRLSDFYTRRQQIVNLSKLPLEFTADDVVRVREQVEQAAKLIADEITVDLQPPVRVRSPFGFPLIFR